MWSLFRSKIPDIEAESEALPVTDAEPALTAEDRGWACNAILAIDRAKVQRAASKDSRLWHWTLFPSEQSFSFLNRNRRTRPRFLPPSGEQVCWNRGRQAEA
jgi:hypothetical protein